MGYAAEYPILIFPRVFSHTTSDIIPFFRSKNLCTNHSICTDLFRSQKCVLLFLEVHTSRLGALKINLHCHLAQRNNLYCASELATLRNGATFVAQQNYPHSHSNSNLIVLSRTRTLNSNYSRLRPYVAIMFKNMRRFRLIIHPKPHPSIKSPDT